MGMKGNQSEKKSLKFILALHSTSEEFGVAIINYADQKALRKHSVFPIGKNLSNKLFSCVQSVLPSENWKQISRIAVATGPGGFTGTRLSLVMARTLSEQIGCPLDGISSFNLMAPRLHLLLNETDKDKPFWIVKDVPRRGKIGGKYQIKNITRPDNQDNFIEIEKPHLIKRDRDVNPAIDAKEDVSRDVIELLNISKIRHKENKNNSWVDVLPIYPTSPIDNIDEKL